MNQMDYFAIASALIGLSEQILAQVNDAEVTPAMLLDLNKRLLAVSVRMGDLITRVQARTVN